MPVRNREKDTGMRIRCARRRHFPLPIRFERRRRHVPYRRAAIGTLHHLTCLRKKSHDRAPSTVSRLLSQKSFERDILGKPDRRGRDRRRRVGRRGLAPLCVSPRSARTAADRRRRWRACRLYNLYRKSQNGRTRRPRAVIEFGARIIRWVPRKNRTPLGCRMGHTENPTGSASRNSP